MNNPVPRSASMKKNHKRAKMLAAVGKEKVAEVRLDMSDIKLYSYDRSKITEMAKQPDRFP